MLAESYVAIFRGRFPASYREALREACASIAAETGRSRDSITVDLLGKWRTGSVPIPADVAAVMRAAVVGAWPGAFDRAGLLSAIALPDPAIRAGIKARRNVNKRLATVSIQS